MCISLTLVLTLLYIIIIEVNLQGFTESISLRYKGKPTSRAQISSPKSLYLKAVKEPTSGVPELVPLVS